MSELPPQPPLTEAQRDALLIQGAKDSAHAAATGDIAVEQGQALGLRVTEIEGRLGHAESKIETLSAQVLAGVHKLPEEEAIPTHLSPPPIPSMRPPMSTHESLEVLNLKTETLDKKQDDQTSLLQKMQGNQGKVIAAFIGMILMSMFSNCQPDTLQKWIPHKGTPAPAPAVTAAPSPAPSR